MQAIKHLISAVLVTVVVTGTSSVSANLWGGGKGFESGLFFDADINRDERLDINEAKAVKNQGEDEIFTRYDEDESDYITRLEFKEFMQKVHG